jgi:two-component system sensor histidine kinase/response regulator
MSEDFTQKASIWVRGLTSSWSVLTRVLVGMLIVQLAILFATIAITTTGYRQAGLGPAVTSNMRALILIQALSVAVAFGATASMAVVLARTLTRRIRRLTDAVEEQVSTGNFHISLETIEQDEIGRLVVALNKLGKAYRNSLDDLAHRAEEMSMLNLVASTINSTLDLQQVFDTSLREAVKTVDWDMGAIYMWDERIERLNVVSFVGLSVDAVRHIFSYALGEGVPGIAAGTGKEISIEDYPNHPRYAAHYVSGLPITLVCIPLRTVPGKLLGVLYVGSSVQDKLTGDKVDLLTTVAHQMTLAIDKAQLYHQVSQHADELERVVEARTAQLAQAIDELSVALDKAREADKVKSLLLTTVSHELRTPLATLKGSTSLLIEAHDRIDSKDLVQILQDIEDETDKLTGLISSLLEMSRIEAGVLQIKPQSIDLAQVIQSTVNAARRRINTHELALHIPAELPTCFGDALRIQQILANLLDNAAKYSDPGTTIRVRAVSEDGELVVSVKDQGRGIAKEHLEAIFDRFYQIKSSHNSANRGDAGRRGIGLGLSICKGLVEAHGGRIWVESVEGVGSTFFFSLPTAAASTSGELADTGG